MKLLVSLLPGMPMVTSSSEVAVVIDVLRATTVMTTALATGALSVITTPSVDDARRIAKAHPNALLCGERECVRIDGFDLGNSPADYLPSTVKQRTVILTTTNGTAAIAECKNAQTVVAASFLNYQAVLNMLKNKSQVHLVCSGTNGAITLEDTLLAGLFVSAIQQFNPNVELVGDEPRIACQVWRSWFGDATNWSKSDLVDCFAQSQGGRNLIAKGFDHDLAHCAVETQLDVLPKQTEAEPATFCSAGLIE